MIKALLFLLCFKFVSANIFISDQAPLIKSKYAYVTLLTSDSFLPGTRVLVTSLRNTNTTYDIVVLILPHISFKVKQELCLLGKKIKLIQVEYIENPYRKNMVSRKQIHHFCKLRTWDLNYEKIIFMDSDMLVLQNIDEVFDVEPFAAVENFESNLAATNSSSKFNSGLMLIKPSKNTFERMLNTFEKFESYNGGDQGFLNSFYGKSWFRLPVEYNVNKFLFESGVTDLKMEDVKVVHFVRQKPWIFEKGSHLTVFDKMWNEFNSKILLKSKRINTKTENRFLVGRPNHCVSVIKNVFYRNTRKEFADDVTAVTIASLDRLHRLLEFSTFWTGPISVGVFSNLTATETILTLLSFPFPFERITFNLMIQNTSIHKEFPINALRNLAIENVKEDLTFYVDVDFYPMYDFYWKLVRHRSFRYIWEKSKRIFIVPAFEFNLDFYKDSYVEYPEDKPSIIKLFQEKRVTMFHPLKQGHRATNHEKWIDAKTPYKVQHQRWFEPYFIARKSMINETRWFDERFVDRGRNKLCLALELWLKGFEFLVVPDSFLIHAFENRTEYLPGMKGRGDLFDQVEKELRLRYNNTL